MDSFRKYLQRRRANKVPMDDDLETENERKERFQSLYIMYFTMFLMALGFSIVLTGIYPYIEKLVPGEGIKYAYYVVAANPLGQMLFSPLVGWWGNKRGSVRLPLLMTLVLFVLASIAYAIVQIIPGENKLLYLFFARFFVGVSSANIALARSYLSAATRFSERTKAVSMVSLCQVLGFVVGPPLQAALEPLVGKGTTFFGLPFNMYSATGWVNALLGLINFILLLPWCFKERKIAAREAMRLQGKSSEKEAWKNVKLDKLAAWTLIVAFSVLVSNFVLLEVLGSPLTMHMFAWTGDDSTFYMGILMGIGGAIACVMFSMIQPLCKIIAERKVMVWGGFFLMIVGRIFCMPWGPGTPRIAFPDPITHQFKFENGTEIVGCPSTQEWCFNTPQLTMYQFIIGYGFTTLGYPIGTSLLNSIFSKVLGPRPQGVWMGLMTGAGSASRVVGPIFVGKLYENYGPHHALGITGMTLVLAMIWLLIVNKRLIPVEPDKNLKDPVESTLIRDSIEPPKDIEMQPLNGKVAYNKD